MRNDECRRRMVNRLIRRTCLCRANRHMANRLWQIGIWQKGIWQNDVVSLMNQLSQADQKAQNLQVFSTKVTRTATIASLATVKNKQKSSKEIPSSNFTFNIQNDTIF